MAVTAGKVQDVAKINFPADSPHPREQGLAAILATGGLAEFRVVGAASVANGG